MTHEESAMPNAGDIAMDEYRAATDAAACFDLSARTKIEIAGPDALTFLHNLCTQDVKSLAVGATGEAFLTTNKARVVAHAWITRRDDNTLFLDAIAGQGERILQHLNRFLISEQVELTDRTREYGFLRIIGPKAGALLESLGIAPARRHRLLAVDGFDLLPRAADVDALKRRLLDAGAVLAADETYHVLRVEAGLPEYGIDIDEDRLAMEVNRDNQAISYSKGCYLGQETIVMARDRGQVNRRLTGLQAVSGGSDCPSGLQPGAKLYRDQQEVGQVTSSVFSPRLGRWIALAYLRRGGWDAGVEVAASDGAAAVVCALPFCSAGETTLP